MLHLKKQNDEERQHQDPPAYIAATGSSPEDYPHKHKHNGPLCFVAKCVRQGPKLELTKTFHTQSKAVPG